MARIPDHEIEQLKLQVSLVRVVEASGVVLKSHGKDLIGKCPFHNDKTPSLVISPKSNLWHCLGACQVGGSVMDWVMRFEGVGFRRAVEMLRGGVGLDGYAAGRVLAMVPDDEDPSTSSTARSAAPLLGGAVIDMQEKSIASKLAPTGSMAKKSSSDLIYASSDDGALLNRVMDFYCRTLKQSSEGLGYLAKRGLDHRDVVDHFKLGFANRTLGYQLPAMTLKAGTVIRRALQRIGILRAESGHEHLNGSIVIPVFGCDERGEQHVVEMYGRKITPNLRQGTPLHLYLPGPHRGVFNEVAFATSHDEMILCESLIDALTFWCAGYRNVTSSFGIEGFTLDILDALKRYQIKRVLIAYDADEAGNIAAEKLSHKLMGEGFDCYRIVFPKGMDANDYALAVKPARQSLGVVIRQAQWMGKGTAPVREIVDPVVDVVGATSVANASVVDLDLAVDADLDRASVFSLVAAVDVDLDVGESNQNQTRASRASSLLQDQNQNQAAASRPKPLPPELDQNRDEAIPAYRVPPVAAPLPVEIKDHELILTLGDRVYTARGIEKNLSYEQLKIWLRVCRGDFVFIDMIELYQSKQRASWMKAASIELGLSEDVLKSDLGKLLRVIEQRQDALIKQKLKPASTQNDADAAAAALASMTPSQTDAALGLLRDPKLIDRIIADVETTGVVGEASNALVAYLACVSRKLDKPLAILIQSTSAAGKSTLMDALLALMPESERVHYSAMTGQSLFYLGETSMKHKILAIAEEEGVRQAAYALKLLQSQGELTIASTGKDPTTGQLVTQEYRVEGPVMLFLTTTAIDIDEELLNRCLVLTINESREQTAAIQAKQRASRTLNGLMTKAHSEAVLDTHRCAQQLLRPLAVVNPFAESLTFASDRVRLRRDHQKYLSLIDAIALLHQHQREIKSAMHANKIIEYIEVTLDDIALANRLAHEVLGRSLDELPPQTRRVLGLVQQFVIARAQEKSIEKNAVRFTRREIREHVQMSEKQLRVHLDRLVELEYVLPHAGRHGQRFCYELIFDGDVLSDQTQVMGLQIIDAVGDTTANFVGAKPNFVVQNQNLVPRSWPDSGQIVGASSSKKNGHNPHSNNDLFNLVAVDDETALIEEKKSLDKNHHRSRSSDYRSNGAHQNGSSNPSMRVAASEEN